MGGEGWLGILVASLPPRCLPGDEKHHLIVGTVSTGTVTAVFGWREYDRSEEGWKGIRPPGRGAEHSVFRLFHHTHTRYHSQHTGSGLTRPSGRSE